MATVSSVLCASTTMTSCRCSWGTKESRRCRKLGASWRTVRRTETRGVGNEEAMALQDMGVGARRVRRDGCPGAGVEVETWIIQHGLQRASLLVSDAYYTERDTVFPSMLREYRALFGGASRVLDVGCGNNLLQGQLGA